MAKPEKEKPEKEKAEKPEKPEKPEKNFKLPADVREYYRNQYDRYCKGNVEYLAKKAVAARDYYERKKAEKIKNDPNYVPRSVGRPRKHPIVPPSNNEPSIGAEKAEV